VDIRFRLVEDRLKNDIRKPWVHVLFGARQTGKTVLLNRLAPTPDLKLNFADPEERTRHLADPGLLRRECEALPAGRSARLVVIDEAQLVPTVFDAVQVMFDSNRSRWRFVLCGSSARKLRKAGTNLLPGRSMLHHLYPLVSSEYERDGTLPSGAVAPLPDPNVTDVPLFDKAGLEARLGYGDLPGIVCAPEEDRSDLLRSYATVHLEEEIRREAYVRDWGTFVNFVRLAAASSGKPVNFSSISRETGVSVPTVKSYYQILVDMFVGFFVPAYSGSTWKSLLSTPRFLFFDLGVRHAAAGLRPSRSMVAADPGGYLEQWVGIELQKRLGYTGDGELRYLRTKSGAEIDYLLVREGVPCPIEVKWTERPSIGDARHIREFFRRVPESADGFVVCRCERPQKLADRVTAIPWSCI
jgi:predicted AAA+ superfamily ATPase